MQCSYLSKKLLLLTQLNLQQLIQQLLQIKKFNCMAFQVVVTKQKQKKREFLKKNCTSYFDVQCVLEKKTNIKRIHIVLFVYMWEVAIRQSLDQRFWISSPNTLAKKFSHFFWIKKKRWLFWVEPLNMPVKIDLSQYKLLNNNTPFFVIKFDDI